MTEPEQQPQAVEHATFIEALLAVQAEAPSLRLGKDAAGQVGSQKYKYLSLDKLMDAVLPLLTKHGLVWITCPDKDDEGNPTLSYELLHTTSTATNHDHLAGIKGNMPLLLDKTTSQGLGSAITYARRYSLAAVLGLTPDEDDDGAAASRSPAEPVAPFGPAATGNTISRTRNAIGFLLNGDLTKADKILGQLLEKVAKEGKSGEYLPLIACRAIGLIATELKESSEDLDEHLEGDPTAKQVKLAERIAAEVEAERVAELPVDGAAQ